MPCACYNTRGLASRVRVLSALLFLSVSAASLHLSNALLFFPTAHSLMKGATGGRASVTPPLLWCRPAAPPYCSRPHIPLESRPTGIAKHQALLLDVRQ